MSEGATPESGTRCSEVSFGFEKEGKPVLSEAMKESDMKGQVYNPTDP